MFAYIHTAWNKMGCAGGSKNPFKYLPPFIWLSALITSRLTHPGILHVILILYYLNKNFVFGLQLWTSTQIRQKYILFGFCLAEKRMSTTPDVSIQPKWCECISHAQMAWNWNHSLKADSVAVFCRGKNTNTLLYFPETCSGWAKNRNNQNNSLKKRCLT